MPYLEFPYGSGRLGIELPDSRCRGQLVSALHRCSGKKSPMQLVEDALENPVGSPKLRDLARGKKNIVILASDHTRPVPSKLILPPMLRELRAGAPGASITILVATGCHRKTSPEELRQKFGSALLHSARICIHDCDDEDHLVDLGKLPSGGALILNRLAVEADLLVAEGFVEPHFFAGFSGGRKSVLPGIAGRTTVLYNHNAAFIADPHARTGVLEDNPIHRDMLYAAHAAKLAFICNVVLDAEKRVVYACAGDMEQAHLDACNYLRAHCQVAAEPAEIVITSNGGYPLDQNIYQAVKGMTAAEAVVQKGGVIIMLAQCKDGHGGASFYRTFKEESDLCKLTRRILSTPAERTIVDQWQSQIFVRVLQRASVILVSDVADEIVRNMHMIPAHSISDAIQKADQLLASRGIHHAGVLAIPDGVSVIVRQTVQ